MTRHLELSERLREVLTWYGARLPHSEFAVITAAADALDAEKARADAAEAEVVRLRELIADHQHELGLEAFTAPDADLDTMMDSLRARIGDLLAKLAAIEALHYAKECYPPTEDGGKRTLCASDLQYWPCLTARILHHDAEVQR